MVRFGCVLTKQIEQGTQRRASPGGSGKSLDGGHAAVGERDRVVGHEVQVLPRDGDGESVTLNPARPDRFEWPSTQFFPLGHEGQMMIGNLEVHGQARALFTGQ
jgi:hypothetical protein